MTACLVKRKPIESERMRGISPSMCLRVINGGSTNGSALELSTSTSRQIRLDRSPSWDYGHGRGASLVRGESLNRRRLCDELAQYDLLVTFNGASFDLPVLLATFQDLPLNQPHIDICCLGRQLGYRGGLKAIERQLGIQRSSELQGMSGDDAVRLWNRWRHTRDEGARARLLAYNEADCVNLQPLADTFYCLMAQQLKTQQGRETA